MRAASWILVSSLVLLLVCVAGLAADDKSGLDGEGFVQQWLVLAPIPLGDNESGADGLDKQQLKDEAKLKPREGDKVKVGGKELVWKKHACKDHLLDFNDLLGAQTEDSVAYAVTFVVAPEEMKGVRMKTGSDDQAKV